MAVVGIVVVVVVGHDGNWNTTQHNQNFRRFRKKKIQVIHRLPPTMQYKSHRTRTSRRKFGYHQFPLVIGCFISLGVFVALSVKTDLSTISIWLISINVATFALFFGDKVSSKIVNAPRVPEIVFHICTIFGGIIGQYLGRNLFHHKTNIQRHPSFRRIQYLSLLIWSILLLRKCFKA